MRLKVSGVPHRRPWLWLIVVGLVALSGSAMAVRIDVLLLVLALLVIPMFALTVYASFRTASSRVTSSPDHAVAVVSTPFAGRPPEESGVDADNWNNEGGGQGSGIAKV